MTCTTFGADLTSTTCADPDSGGPKVPKLRDILRTVKLPDFREDKGGSWPFEPSELIRDLMDGKQSLDDPKLQSLLLDWIESADYNIFLNKDTEEQVYALAAKRGNIVYPLTFRKRRGTTGNIVGGNIASRSRASDHGKRCACISHADARRCTRRKRRAPRALRGRRT